MRKVRFVFCLVAFFAAVSAVDAETPDQGILSHFSSHGECELARDAPFYYPAKPVKRFTRSENEIVLGTPTGACVDMELPEVLGGRGWVRIEAGRRLVYSRTTGKALRLEECDNEIYELRPFLDKDVPTPRPRPISDEVAKRSVEVQHSFVEPLMIHFEGGNNLRPADRDEVLPPERSWIKRHWKWLVPLGAATGVGGWCVATRCIKTTIIQEVNH